MIIRELVTKWLIDVDNTDVDAADKKIKKLKDNIQRLGRGSVALGKGLTAGLTLPIIALGGFALKAAADAEETRSKFAEIFKGISEDSERAAKNLAKNFGLSETASKDLLASTGDILVGLGLERSEALRLSEQVNQLSADVTSFKNVQGGVPRTSAAITKALLGERESLKSLGIAILEEDVKQKVRQLRSQGITFESERQAKAIATLRLITERSKDAIGDFSRTQGSLTNQSRILSARLKTLQESFGELLIPLAQLFIKGVTPLVDGLNNMSKEGKTTVLVVLGMVAAVGPLLILFGSMINGIFAINAGLAAMAIAFNTTKIAAVGMMLLWAAAIIFALAVFEDLFSFLQGRESVIGNIVDQFNGMFDSLNEGFSKLPKIVRVAMALALTPIRTLFSAIQGVGGALGAISVGDFSGAFDAIKQAGKNIILPDLNDSASLIGLGGAFRNSRTPGAGVKPTPSSVTNASSSQSIQIKQENNISVPAGTPAPLVSDAIRQGTKESMDESLRATREALQPQVAF